MSRRSDPVILDLLLDIFKIAPTWLGPVLAAVAFAGVRWGLALWFTPARDALHVRGYLPAISWLAAGLVLLVWVIAEAGKLSNRLLFARTSGSQAIDALSWQEFEQLIAEYYRQHGYVAECVGNATGDGGVDVVLRGKGETVLVQCKHWKDRKVGVRTVRELLGVVTHDRATRGIVITSGRFTVEARRFAVDSGKVSLVEGTDLVRMIEEARRRGR